MSQLDYQHNMYLREAEEAAAERQYHANHVCNETCPPAASCPRHGTVSENCDEMCLEAKRPNLFR